ncbi:hypothetical protein B0H14DRAFT_3465327 [Mycena olivaceomarginata]|nr:hypothetical protein B0H14DRAFT_3465327 [Mycena olivaceomarginata]
MTFKTSTLCIRQTLLHRNSKWGLHVHAHSHLGSFNSLDRGLMAMLMSWGDIHANTTAQHEHFSVFCLLLRFPKLQVVSRCVCVRFFPPEPSIKPYTLMPMYFPTPLPTVPESRSGSEYLHSLSPDSHSPSASGARNTPLSFPMLSPMLCVNVNTDPRMPISPHMCAGLPPVQLASSHLHPANLHGTISLARLGSPHLHPHATCSPRLPHLHPASPTAPSHPSSVLSQRADTKEAQEVQHGREGTAIQEFQPLAYSLVQLASLKTAYKPLEMSF